MSTNILLIDLSSIAHPLFHVSASDPDPNATSIKTVERVRALASGQPHVAICADSGRSFRRDIDPTYKANRPPSDATLQHQIALAVETLQGDGFPVWAVKGFEADDLIATACKLAETSTFVSSPVSSTVEVLPPERVTVASADKDLLQLVSDRVLIKSLTDGSIIDEDAVQQKFGVKPHQMRDYLSLVGDSSDNVKGAVGIGPKKAAALLGAFGNIDDMYTAMDKGEAKMLESTAKALTEFRPRLETVRALIALRTDAPLPFEEVFRERVPADVAVFDGSEPMTLQEAQDVAEDVGGSGASRDRAAVVGPAGAGPDPGRPAAVAGSEGGASRSANAGTGVDSGRAGPLGTQPSLTDHAQGSQQHQTTSSMGTAAPVGLAVRDAEVLPPPSDDPRWQLEPRSMQQAIDLAKHMHASRLFSAYGTPQAVLSTIMAGREIGLQAQKALRAFHIIDGKPAESADLIRAQCLQSGMCEFFRIVERSNTKATWVTKRKGDPEVSLTYTIEEGRRAWQKDQKAWDASGWGKRPANMVTKTAAATLARLIYPDVVLGMYCPEELIGEELQ